MEGGRCMKQIILSVTVHMNIDLPFKTAPRPGFARPCPRRRFQRTSLSQYRLSDSPDVMTITMAKTATVILFFIIATPFPCDAEIYFLIYSSLKYSL